MEPQNSSKTWPVILAVVITAAVVGGGIYLREQKQGVQEPATPEIMEEQNSQIPEQPKEDEDPTASWKTYSASEYQFKYPANYTIEEPTESFKSLVVRGPQGKLEIFKPSDFAERPFGFTGEETQEDIDGYVPKETREIASEDITPGPAHSSAYEIWLFWPKGNSEIKEEIQQIDSSVEIK